jgi:hypothetical protein
MKLHSIIRDPKTLPLVDIQHMYALMERHYENIVYESFTADLAEKEWLIELREVGTNLLRGFSTQMVLECEHSGGTTLALFSGDTIVDKEYWGSTALAIAWGKLAVHVIEMNPDRSVYWFLICKGFRTYRFLSVFFNEFYPCWNRPFTPELKRVLDELAASKFPQNYDPHRGILKADEKAYRIKSEVDMLSACRSDPHVKFFLEHNPHYNQGDELCCLTPLTLDNFSAAARRLMASPAFLCASHDDC